MILRTTDRDASIVTRKVTPYGHDMSATLSTQGSVASGKGIYVCGAMVA